MSSKEQLLYGSLVASLPGEELSSAEKTVLLVHAILLSNGYVPSAISSSVPGHVCLLPSEQWPQSTDGVYSFSYHGGIEMKIVVLNEEHLVAHISDGKSIKSLELSSHMQPEDVTRLVKGNLLPQHEVKQHQQVEEHQRRVYQVHEPSRPSERGLSPPRAPLFGTPVGPGELVGPNHPIFTGEDPSDRQRPGGLRDPRFDPLGPGFIGEPNNDEFPPPPFGQPPGRLHPPGRAPLRGPHANMGPGGMFM
jgi:hypothetical protein